MTTRDFLTAARALIASPNAWTTCPRGVPCEHAIGEYCGYGAIIAVTAGSKTINDDLAACVSMLDHAAPVKGFPDWEATATHAEVLACFDRALASERCGGCGYCRPVRRVA